MFKGKARLTLPDGLNVEDLRRSLEAIADELMVDLLLEDNAPLVLCGLEPFQIVIASEAKQSTGHYRKHRLLRFTRNDGVRSIQARKLSRNVLRQRN